MKVVDMHCDSISAIRYERQEGKACSLRKNKNHLDLEKMQKGDYLLQNFAMFVDTDRPEDPLEAVLHLIDLYQQEMEANRDIIGRVTSYEDIERNSAAGKMSALLSVEEGAVCKGDLSYLHILYQLGVRMMTITWNHENELGFPNIYHFIPEHPFPCQADYSKGLKEQGISFVKEMEQLGIIIDVSHLSDAGFWDVCHHTRKPFVASHSNARSLCGHPRNLTDDMIRAIAERGGVTGLNYCPEFLEEGATQADCRSRGSRMAEHAKYITNLGGIECLGLGSDFDGIGGDLEIKDCSYLYLLEDALRKGGFTQNDIEHIFYKNVLRVYKEVL